MIIHVYCMCGMKGLKLTFHCAALCWKLNPDIFIP